MRPKNWIHGNFRFASDLDPETEAVVNCLHAFQLLRFPSEWQDYHSCNDLCFSQRDRLGF